MKLMILRGMTTKAIETVTELQIDTMGERQKEMENLLRKDIKTGM